MNINLILKNILDRTGSNYMGYISLLLLVFSAIGMLIAVVIIQVNAEMQIGQLIHTIVVASVGLVVVQIGIQIVLFIYSSQSRARLKNWKLKQSLLEGVKEEAAAWKQITALPWVYALVSVVFSLLFITLPLAIYQHTVLLLSDDQITYTIIGGLVGIIGVVTITSLMYDRAMQPIREILLPKQFDAQLSGTPGIRVFTKLQIIILGLVLLGIALIAPIGYQKTIKVLYTAIGSQEVLISLQTQIIAASMLALALGYILARMLSQTLSTPIKELINTFQEVEKGKLDVRVPVTASDEMGQLAIYFNRMLSRLESLQGGLEKEILDRTAQLRAIVEVGRAASSTTDPGELITVIVNTIHKEFGHYYAALFLVDPTGKWAELIQATGEAGKLLKENKHRLEIGGKSMVSAAITRRQGRIALDVGREATRFDNPLLPYTRSEIALPLMVGDSVLGALDVQSTIPEAFTESDIETLQGMANQLAIALQNAYNFQEIQRNLEEIRAAHRQYITTSWQKLSTTRKNLEYSADGVGSKLPEQMTAVAVPISLRDQIIGQISLERDTALSMEEQGFIEAVATQTALALENARLLEESQYTALQESLSAEITSKIWSSTTIDGILRTAVTELGRTMNTTETKIELDLD